MAATLRVNLLERSYNIAITHNDPSGIGAFVRERVSGGKAFIVTDEHVVTHAQIANAALQKAGFQTSVTVRQSGESQKSLAAANELYDALVDIQADRKTLVVAVGGGVIGDLAGFVASTFNRGLPLFMVPTTLLAMVDSAVGGKVAVNHPRGKNLIGAFHQPIGVWIDTAVLASLPEREFKSGLAEVVKYGVILDADFFAYLEGHIQDLLQRQHEVIEKVVLHCCRLKANIVEEDEHEETGLRAVLNYGHTFAHAFETVAGYGAWLHGEAVAAGMICASMLAQRRGLIGADVTERQRRLLTAFGLPVVPDKSWPAQDLLTAMRSDKKALAGRLRFILPQRLGEVTLFDDVPEREVLDVIAS